MNLQGDFEGLFLSSIFQLLCNEQKTGLLRVTSKANEAKVFFKDGTIVYASGSHKEARLGFILRSEGIISEDQLEKCLSLAREKKLSLGKILVDKGYISISTLEKYNTKQVEEILYNLLLWKKGRFEYRDLKLKLDGMVVTQLNPMKLILEASRRIDEMSVLETVITNDKMVFKISGNVQKTEEIKLNANEWRILSLIDGTRTIAQIISGSGYDEFAVYKIFYSLVSYGLIEQREDVQLGSQDSGSILEILTVYTDILQGIRKQVEKELGDRTATLFEDSKAMLAPRHEALLKEYELSNSGSRNQDKILDAAKEIDDPEEVKEMLIQAFNEYSTAVMKRILEILGLNAIKRIQDEIDRILGYVKKYHPESAITNRVVNDMMNITASVSVDAEGKKSKGLFSLFKGS